MANTKILLGAIGEEDGYLTQDAKNTLFKTSYKTHSQFSSNWNVISNNNGGQSSKFKAGSSHYFRLPFEGDLIMNTYLRFVLPAEDMNATVTALDNPKNYDFLALCLLDKIELLYKSKTLSSFDKNYLANYFKLNLTTEKFLNYRKMSSITTDNNNSTYDKFLDLNVYYIDIPLPFWFTKSEGQALPVWSLTDNDLGINIKLADSFNYDDAADIDNKILDVQILVNYGYLANEEKNKFKNLSIEYVIDQVEIAHKSDVTGSFRKKIQLPKKHYLTHLIWNLTTPSGNIGRPTTNPDKYYFDSLEGIKSSSITFNGNTLISDANSTFTTKITRYNHFKFPENHFKYFDTVAGAETLDVNIHTYSFALKPNDVQVSGFVTTDKFNQVILDVSGEVNGTPILNVYQVHKNIIRFQNGDLNLLFN
jgi:hypothetical protein